MNREAHLYQRNDKHSARNKKTKKTKKSGKSRGKSSASNKGIPAWDLSDFFKSPSDPAIPRLMQSTLQRARAFNKRYKGKLKQACSSPKNFAKMIGQYEDIVQDLYKPLIYSQLLHAESSLEQSRGAFAQRMQAESMPTSKEIMFFPLELGKLETGILKKLIQQRNLEKYKNYLKKILENRKYQLEEDLENLLVEKSLTGSKAFLRLFSDEHSLKLIDCKIGKQRKLSQTELLEYMRSSKRAERKAAAEAMSHSLQQDSRRFAFIYNTLIQDKALGDKRRGYSSPEHSRHLSNEIDQSMVDVMCEVVTSSYPLIRDFYKFKGKVLGLKQFCDYDRYAPIGQSKAKIPFAQARNWILDAFQQFSPEFGQVNSLFFEKNWIDAEMRPGKRGGAFCSFGTPDTHPFVFMNYSGDIGQVYTLAHELGHAAHAYLFRDKGVLNVDTPLPVAETASVFAEMLLFDYMRDQVKDKKVLFSIYMTKIDSIIATVFRQISMYLFEKEVHAHYAKHGELSVEQFNQHWRKTQQQLYGKSVKLSEGYDYWWSYIPHFMHTPFYVYAYAFGELLTLSLYAQYKQQGQKFVPKYLDMLRQGAARSPQELFQPLGVNLNKREFWQSGMKVFRDLIQQARELQ